MELWDSQFCMAVKIGICGAPRVISSHLRLKGWDTNSWTEMVSPLTTGVSSMKNSSTLSTAAMRERERVDREKMMSLAVFEIGILYCRTSDNGHSE